VYQSDTEILFPMRVAPRLRDLRGALWQATIDRAIQSKDASQEQLALSLVMIRLAGCMTCHPNSYRAMRGCTTCAMATIRRFRGEDEDLTGMVSAARHELDGFEIEGHDE
jgi:hypothetical protein